MKKKFISSVESAAAMGLGLASLGCGGAIEGAANGWAMLGWTALAVVLGGAAVALLGLAVANCQETAGSRTSHRFGPACAGALRSSPIRGAGESRKKNGRKAG